MSRPLVIGLVFWSLFVATPAGATCGSAYCFLDTGTREGLQEKSFFTVNLAFQYVNQSRRREGSSGTEVVLTPKVNFEDGELELDHHREVLTLNTLVQVDIAYGLTERLSMFAHLPLINERDHEHYDDVGTPEESFSKQDGSAGFGDVQLGLRYGLLVKGKDLLIGSLGVKLPTGSYSQRDSEGAINEPTIQPGTGSTDGVGGLRWSHQVRPGILETFLSTSHKFTTENDLEYKFGDETVISAGFRHHLPGLLTWSVQLNGRHTERDRFLGLRVPSTGADLVNLSPGLRLATSSGTQFYGFVQYPIYQNVNETQLTPRAGILLGVSKTFQ